MLKVGRLLLTFQDTQSSSRGFSFVGHFLQPFIVMPRFTITDFTLKTPLFLTIFLLSFIPFSLLAEGTKSIAPSTADEVALFIGAGDTGFGGGDYGMFAWKDSPSKFHFNIQNSCEKAYFGFSVPKTNRNFSASSTITEDLIFRIIAPDGTPLNDLACFGNTTINGEVWQILNATTANISTRTEADNGPAQLGNTGGYTAFELDLTACGITQTGNYSIEFYTTDLPYDPNTSASGFYIPLFDVTVADCSNTDLTGRVWSNNWGFGIKNDGDGPFDRAFNGSFYVCSTEGFITRLDFNSGVNTRAEAGKNNDQRSGFRAGAFNVSFNNTGPANTGNILTDRQSVPSLNSPNPTLPVFLNLPDESLCPEPEIGAFQAATKFITGCPLSRCINIEASAVGQFEILIEGPGGNGIFDDPTDRLLAYLITEADKTSTPQNPDFEYEICVPWDGKDGAGNFLFRTDITVNGSFSQGIYHFPVYDAEFNDDGFKVETVRPAYGPQAIFYDDRMITESSNTTEPKDGQSGCAAPCHQWTGEWEDYADKDEVYGNFNTINSWWFANTIAQDLSTSIVRTAPITITCPPDVNDCPNGATDTAYTGVAVIEVNSDCPITLDFEDTVLEENTCLGTTTIQRTWKAFFDSMPDSVVSCVQTITLSGAQFVNCPKDTILSCTADGETTYSWTPPTVESNCSTCPEETEIEGFMYLGEREGHRYYCSMDRADWADAKAGATSIGGYLAVINDHLENEYLASFLINQNAYIGLTDEADEGKFKWVNGDPLGYTNWATNQPNNLNGNEHYGQLFYNGRWSDIPGTDSLEYIIEVPCTDFQQIEGPLNGGAFPIGTTTVTYQIGPDCDGSNTCSFTVTVESDMTIECSEDIVIDCGDGQNGAEVTWEPPTAIGCCNNCPPVGEEIEGFVYMGEYKGHQYYCSKEKATWPAAKAIAENNGGYLAVINDLTESNMLGTFLANQNAFIGLHDTNNEGEYEWVNGDPFVFTNWYPGQPNNKNGDQDYVQLLPDGRWDDIYTDKSLEFIMELPCLDIQQIEGLPNGNVFPVGTTTVTYSVEDDCGQKEACSFDVTVNPCPLVAPKEYCEAKGENINYFWIRHVVLGGINNPTVNDGGYGDYTHLSTDIQPGTEQTLILSPEYARSRYWVYWTVWIDFNNDGDFDDVNEEVLTYREYRIIKTKIDIPYDAVPGATRMRVSMKYGRKAGSCETFRYGEVEDYTINISSASLVNASAKQRKVQPARVEILEKNIAPPKSNLIPEDNPLLKVFPNPVAKNLNVQLSNFQQKTGTLNIYNQLGQTIHQQAMVGQTDQNLVLNLEHIPAGLYFISIESKGQVPIVQKFYKE